MRTFIKTFVIIFGSIYLITHFGEVMAFLAMVGTWVLGIFAGSIIFTILLVIIVVLLAIGLIRAIFGGIFGIFRR